MRISQQLLMVLRVLPLMVTIGVAEPLSSTPSPSIVAPPLVSTVISPHSQGKMPVKIPVKLTMMPTKKSLPVANHAARVHKAETVRFQNGDTVTLRLSNQNANRLLLPRDTIAGVVCPPFRCHATLPTQDTSHSVYLTIPITVTQPFTVHVSTLAHRYFSAWVSPKKIPGVTVLLEPTSPGWTKKTVHHNSEPWVGQVSDLIGDILRQQPPDDYAVVTFPKAKRAPLTPQLTAKKTLAYRGEFFTVTRYTLSNQTKQFVTLKEPEFYRAGVVAVALSHQLLPPKGHATLYQVTTTGGPL